VGGRGGRGGREKGVEGVKLTLPSEHEQSPLLLICEVGYGDDDDDGDSPPWRVTEVLSRSL